MVAGRHHGVESEKRIDILQQRGLVRAAHGWRVQVTFLGPDRLSSIRERQTAESQGAAGLGPRDGIVLGPGSQHSPAHVQTHLHREGVSVLL